MILALLLAAGSSKASAEFGDLKNQLSNFTGDLNFGQSVAVVGSAIAIGVPSFSPPGVGTTDGLVRLYSGRGGSTGSITPPEPGGAFGAALASDGRDLLIGAPDLPVQGLTVVGQVYLRQGTGALVPIPNPNPREGAGFGLALAISDLIAIGAPLDTHPVLAGNPIFTSSGSAYLFSTTGTLLRELIDPDPKAFKYFGSSVAVVGNYAAVGAPAYAADGTNYTGIVYLYDADPNSPDFGELVHTIEAPAEHKVSVRQFGDSLLALDDALAIGDPGEEAVYIHEIAAGSSLGDLIRTLGNPGTPGNDFGRSLALSEQRLIVGAPMEVNPALATDISSVFVIDIDEGSPSLGVALAQIANPSPDRNDYFGTAVAALPNGDIVATAPGDTASRGSGYIFDGLFDSVPSPVSFEVSRATSDFNVMVQGQGGATMNLRPNVSGGLDALVYQKNGQVTGLLITGVDLRAEDESSEQPFHFELRGMRAVMGNGRGRPRVLAKPDPRGAFNQSANEVQFDGRAMAQIGDQLLEDEGGPNRGALVIPLPGTLEKQADGFHLNVPFDIDRDVANGEGDFNPRIHAFGMMMTREIPISRIELVRYLIGLSEDDSGLDLNSDAVVDIADLIFLNLLVP